MKKLEKILETSMIVIFLTMIIAGLILNSELFWIAFVIFVIVTVVSAYLTEKKFIKK